MIKVQNVSKRWDEFELEDVSFEIPKGYICGLVGENGAGKTTLINMITGLYRTDIGDIFVNGYDMKKEEIKAKDGIGYVLNEELFDPYISLKDNADAYGKYYSKYDRDSFIEYCDKFQIDSSKKLKALSKGQKLKFQFAFALSHKPDLLILDEPTANFDPDFRKEFFKILIDFISDGEHSVLLATHLTSDLERVGDYITFLHNGKMVFSKDRETLENSYRLVSGANYKINLIPKDKVVHIERKDDMASALVRHSSLYKYDDEVSVIVPSIEDIMYHYIKEDAYV